jgi:hypothetical protein
MFDTLIVLLACGVPYDGIVKLSLKSRLGPQHRAVRHVVRTSDVVVAKINLTIPDEYNRADSSVDTVMTYIYMP